ncbi:uncharacterized protein LOC144884640 [Branchiostoma floridae x Branchiostoma japonicum]
MTDTDMAKLAHKLQDLLLNSQHSPKVVYGQALKEAIVSMDCLMEAEVLKSLGDLHFEKGKLSKDSAEFDKAAALYAVALLRCTDPDMGQTLEHRIGYMEKLSRQLLQGYSPHFLWLSQDYWGDTDSNVLRVAKICTKLDKRVKEFLNSAEEIYTKTLITAIENSDMFLELEVLKALGDLYLDKGKTTCNLSQFSKASAMYDKALARCEDPGTKQTLQHRVLYMVKIWGAVRRRQSQRNSRQSGKGLDIAHKSRDNTKLSTAHNQPIHPDIQRKTSEPGITTAASNTAEERLTLTDSQYKDHLKKGDSSLTRADLDSAEEHFAAALKMVHVRDPTAQHYQREVEPLCKLGDVYSKRGQQTGDRGDFVKAAALYNAAMARSKDKVVISNITIAVKRVGCIFKLGIQGNVSQDDTDKHKKQLKEMRDQIKLEMETIDQQLDPYVHDEDDPCVKEMEAKRAKAVRHLFEKIAQQRKEFISQLVEECIGLMGPPPCKYALIGLGSQATGLVTPYSDLEFAILVEEESEESLVYFRNLTHYLHLKVVNLGETILPALGIKSLNDFYSKNPLDNWYYDSVTPRGFAFDGSMPKASKTPLGSQKTTKEPASELICTPSNMVAILQTDVTLYLKEGYHLGSILRNPCLITGNQDLIDVYKSTTAKILQEKGGKMSLQLAQETLKENIARNSDEETITPRLIDVKKKIYRFPAIAVDCMALSSCIIPTTVWNTIEDMETQQVISPNNAHHLMVLTSISAELRLRTYIANGGQKENLSALASMETLLHVHGKESPPLDNDEEQKDTLKKVFHLPNEKQLIRYYETADPLRNTLSRRSPKEAGLNLRSDLYDGSPRVRGMMYFELCKYKLAISYFNEGLKSTECIGKERMVLLNHLANAWQQVGDSQQAKSYLEQALQICRNVHGKRTAHPEIAQLINQLGEPHYNTDDKNSICYREQALEMYRTIYGQDTAHPVIAATLNNLGTTCISVGNYRKAIDHIEEALKMHMTFSIYSQSAVHADMLSSLNNLAVAWTHLGDHKKAISYHEQALQLRRSIHGPTAVDPGIAKSLNNLGTAWNSYGDQRRAADYYAQALQMRTSIYGQSTAHPEIARSCNNLGDILGDLGDHTLAIRYIEQALQIERSIYGHNTAHSGIACSLNNLGMHWHHLGDNKKAFSYLNQALQMCRDIYGQSKAHAEIANTLDNLGTAWSSLDNHKTLSYHEQALQMREEIYGQGETHPEIAKSLNNVGQAWSSIGDHGKAINYFEQALQMFRSIHNQSTAHPQIARSILVLGSDWFRYGDYRKAISYCEEALQMYRSIYGQTKAHPDIVSSLVNLAAAWYSLGHNSKAISICQEALALAKEISPSNESYPTIKQIEIFLAKMLSSAPALRSSRERKGKM